MLAQRFRGFFAVRVLFEFLVRGFQRCFGIFPVLFQIVELRFQPPLQPFQAVENAACEYFDRILQIARVFFTAFANFSRTYRRTVLSGRVMLSPRCFFWRR